MKKITDFLKPNILLIFGAFLFFYFFNYLQLRGEGLAIGISAIVSAAYYIAIGVVGLVVGDKLSPSFKKITEVISVCLFAVFMFVLVLLRTIECAKINNFMGPTAWTIAVVSMIAFLALAVIYPIAKLMNNSLALRFAYLFSAIFLLALILDLLFDLRGNSIVLGDFDVLLVALYASFTFYLFSTLGQAEQVKEETPVEEPQVEEVEEAVAEPVEEQE